MDVQRLGLFLITLAAYCAVDANISQTPYENITAGQELRKQLLKDYDKVVVPATSKNLVQMKMTVVFNSVELSYDTSQMTIHAWLKAEWNDNRLVWDPNNYDQIKFIIVEHGEIWHPDFMAYNNIAANAIIDGHTQSLVNSTGKVLWVQPVQYKIHCRADMTYWPYDTQVGVLKVGSWVYSNNVINLTDTVHEIVVLNPHSEWQILRITSEKITKLYACCPNEPYDHVEYNVTVNRKAYRHNPVVFLPATSTALLNLLVFWLSPDDKFKLTSSLFNALIVVVILLVVYSKIPFILSSVPLIVLYYTYSLGLIVLTAVISVVMANMTKTQKPLSKSVQSFVQSKFVDFLGIEKSSTDNQAQCENNETDLQTIKFNKRQIFAKIIDKICFIVFSFIYLILLSRFVF